MAREQDIKQTRKKHGTPFKEKVALAAIKGDRAHNPAEAAFLGGEDVLDPGSRSGAGGIATGDARRHLATARLLRWNYGFRPRRPSKARLAAER